MGVILENKLLKVANEAVEYGAETSERVGGSVSVYIKKDVKAARKLIETTSGVNERSYRIEDECLKILGLHQPVAKDLRMASSILRTAIELERINILSAYIARYAIDSQDSVIPPHIEFMSHTVQEMIKDGLGALMNRDIQLLKRSTKNYLQLQEFYNQLYESQKDFIESSGNLLLVARNLLSMGHHVLGMDDRIAYMIVGKRVIHHKVFYSMLMK
ncbi:phosphate signaling complex PhoU family protein [Methanothermobacter wolfeii]|uniref:phosphate signaling complex PhoU family protein n=1 Tax=Methanothermobacter wolfeii TaxID=145261 RepID=UPI0024B38F8D|nr:phosphate uptake regulator PhoU [Methanothermobacter wolfeii]MDI6703034.1 phosphate uptake regulator PhoU [Methanothermobacter wolfeii]MDI6842702.1 phosphate uptake regulator PhoU [Methanothermobacter wolfeii]